MSIVTPTQLRDVLGVSSSLYSDAYLQKVIDTSELTILPLLVSHSSSVTYARLNANVASLITNTPHNYTIGQSVVVAIGDAVFDGTKTVTAINSEFEFAYAKTNADEIRLKIGRIRHDGGKWHLWSFRHGIVSVDCNA